MSSSSTCTITFNNNPLGVYYAGQTVSGIAELITTRPKTVTSVSITITGFAEVRWTENITKTDTHGKRQKTIETYSGSEIYYNSVTHVFGQSGGTQLELPAGKYAFPFQMFIPSNAPTSFNGAWGQIKHVVIVTIDRVMRYNNIFEQPFSVILPYDLNSDPKYSKALHKIDEKTFCWSLCCSGKEPLVMTVKVPFAAYMPGQRVPFNIILDNRSDVHCSDVKVRLMAKIIYTSRSPETKTKKMDLKIADNHCGEVLKQNKAEFNDYLQIPPTVPSSITTSCSIMEISYTLKFIAKLSHLYTDLVMEFPFTIGTVPIYASLKESSSTVITNQPGADAAANPPTLPPITFQEDVRKEQFESNTFKPKYPIINNNDAIATNAQNGGNADGIGLIATNKNPTPPKLYPDVKEVTWVAPEPIPTIPNSTPSMNITTEKTTSPSAGFDGNGALEVMGFSLSPDYEPTPTSLATTVPSK